MGEPEGECPVRLKKDVKEPALLPKKPDLQEQAALPVIEGPFTPWKRQVKVVLAGPPGPAEVFFDQNRC